MSAGRPKGINKRAISLMMDIDLLEVLKMLATEPGGRFEKRSLSQICSILVAEKLQDIKKENYLHLVR